MNETAALFRLLGDEARLRLLRLLARERLNVSELTGILGLAQSGVSRHLRLLKEAGLLKEDREGGWSYYRVDPDSFPPAVARLWGGVKPQIDAVEGHADDDARLQEVRRHRQEEFRTQAGEGRLLVPGRSWAAWARALGHLVPPLRVADLGCGEGYLAIEAARWARKVTGVDRSAEMIRRAKALAAKRGVKNVDWKQGDIRKVPLPDGSVDAVILSQALHQVAEPAGVLAEAHRILAPGGRLLLLDLRAHREEWVKQRLGDVWLGFEERQLQKLLKEAGFSKVRLEVGARRRGDPFTVLLGSGEKA